jgi:hypothetical protein
VITQSFREGVRCARGVMAEGEIYLQHLGFDPAYVRHPIRYWHGGMDRNIPVAMVRDFVGKTAGAHLHVDEGLGHFSLVLQRVPAAVDCLAECTAGSRDFRHRSLVGVSPDQVDSSRETSASLTEPGADAMSSRYQTNPS